MTISKARAVAACEAHGRTDLAAFVKRLQDTDTAQWMLDDTHSDVCIVSYVDEKKKYEDALQQYNEQIKAALNDVLAEALAPVKELLRVALIGDIGPKAPGSSRAAKQYRMNAVKYYYGYVSVPNTLRCMVTGEELPASRIIAGHVYRKAWRGATLKVMARMTLHDPRNIMLMRKQVKEKFDRFEITIIPQMEEDQFKVVVLKQRLLGQYIGSGSKAENDTQKWKDIDNLIINMQPLQAGSRPARRVLTWHATLAVDYAEKHHWISKGTVQVPEAGWSSPGYDSARMEMLLGHACKNL